MMRKIQICSMRTECKFVYFGTYITVEILVMYSWLAAVSLRLPDTIKLLIGACGAEMEIFLVDQCYSGSCSV